jgi:hypothetical protein
MDKVVAGGGVSLKSVKNSDVDEKYAFQVVAGNGGWHQGISPNHAQQLQSMSLQMLWTASQVRKLFLSFSSLFLCALSISLSPLNPTQCRTLSLPLSPSYRLSMSLCWMGL